MRSILIVFLILSVAFAYICPIDKEVLNALHDERSNTDIFVILKPQVNFETLTDENRRPISELDWNTKGEVVLEALMRTARLSQAPLKKFLNENRMEYRDFYIVNAIAVYNVTAQMLVKLAQRMEVASIQSDAAVDIDFLEPTESIVSDSTDPVEWNVEWINATHVWSKGFTGEGMVVANSDTGVDYTHPALVNNYRGNLGNGKFDHNYNWYDSARRYTMVKTACSPGSRVPCDDNSHGTHTMGTTAGGKDRNIGVAPGAKWIACRSIGQYANADTFLGCLQFFLAPHDLDGKNPKPELRPHTTGHSYGCRSGKAACKWELWDKAIDALSSVGVMVVASAGNAGPSCKTVTGPPGTIPQVFTVAALGVKTHNIASFSSRGTVKEFPEREKPDISASGSSVVSSVPGGRYGTKSGTSMSCPAVNGAVALLWSSRPKLQRDILNTRKLFETTAYHQKTKTCSDKELPNNVYGWGTINIGKAYEESMRLNRD